MKGMWYLIKVENENDIGTNEIERWKVVDSNPQSVNIGGDYNYQSMNIKCDKGTPAKKETDSAPTGKSLEERVKSLEDWTTQMDIEYDANEHWKKQMNLMCIKRFDEMESRTEQLSNEHKELKDAFESECDHYDGNIKSIKRDISDLQQAFVKYAICKKTESPEGGKSFTTAVETEPGEFVFNSSGQPIGFIDRKTTPSGITMPTDEPDLVEQIKAGENRLWELRKSVDCVAAIANSASETVSLKEHVIKLMSIHTGLNITGIRMCNKTYKIHYNCKEKGIYVELD